MSVHSRTSLSILVILSFMAGSSQMSANLAAPRRGGQIVAEPRGLIGVAIRHEVLNIDMRPLLFGKKATVDAEYKIFNNGEVRTVELMFATGTKNDSNFRVLFDGQIITGVNADSLLKKDLPGSWLPPESTPMLSDDEQSQQYLDFFSDTIVSKRFSLTIPSGEHTIHVSYDAEAQINKRGTPLKYHQFAYILAPAKDWDSFGGIDVKVLLPKDWKVAVTPEMKRTDNDTATILTGTFSTIPANAIAITTQATVGGMYTAISYLFNILFGLTIIGGGIFCFRWSKSVKRGWAGMILLPIVWGAVVILAGGAAFLLPATTLPETQVSNYGYNGFFLVVGVMIAGLACACLGWCLMFLNQSRVKVR